MFTQLLPTASLQARDDSRQIQSSRLQDLADSIKRLGLLEPIVVRRMSTDQAETRYEIVAGLHRYTALTVLLNRSEIECRVTEFSDLDAELAAIDENLIRVALSPAQVAKYTARRKQLFELINPDSRAGVAGGRARQGTASDTLSFAAQTAARTGQNVRTIQRSAGRGEKIPSAVLEIVTGTTLDSGVELDALAAMVPEEQEMLAQRAAVGERVSARRAPSTQLLQEKLEVACYSEQLEAEVRNISGTARDQISPKGNALAYRMFTHAVSVGIEFLEEMGPLVQEHMRPAYHACAVAAREGRFNEIALEQAFAMAGRQMMKLSVQAMPEVLQHAAFESHRPDPETPISS